jgi:hypothetical protein
VFRELSLDLDRHDPRTAAGRRTDALVAGGGQAES